jgi:hypothetical protein
MAACAFSAVGMAATSEMRNAGKTFRMAKEIVGRSLFGFASVRQVKIFMIFIELEIHVAPRIRC